MEDHSSRVIVRGADQVIEQLRSFWPGSLYQNQRRGEQRGRAGRARLCNCGKGDYDCPE